MAQSVQGIVPAKDRLHGWFCPQGECTVYPPWADAGLGGYRLAGGVLDDLQDFAKNKGAIFLKWIRPAVRFGLRQFRDRPTYRFSCPD